MWFGVVTLFPEMFAAVSQSGVFGRAIASGAIELVFENPRDHAQDNYRRVDDRPYGGGAGMVMMAPPLAGAVAALRAKAPGPLPVVLMSPQGQLFAQADAVAQAGSPGMILICGRYEGVDERFIERYVDVELSVGDYVVSGGELPAMLVMDAIARHLPGTLGNEMSTQYESHLDGSLEYPQYTRPETFEGLPVPAVLLSGDHGKIAEHRRREALQRTQTRRPDLLKDDSRNE